MGSPSRETRAAERRRDRARFWRYSYVIPTQYATLYSRYCQDAACAYGGGARGGVRAALDEAIEELATARQSARRGLVSLVEEEKKCLFSNKQQKDTPLGGNALGHDVERVRTLEELLVRAYATRDARQDSRRGPESGTGRALRRPFSASERSQHHHRAKRKYLRRATRQHPNERSTLSASLSRARRPKDGARSNGRSVSCESTDGAVFASDAEDLGLEADAVAERLPLNADGVESRVSRLVSTSSRFPIFPRRGHDGSVC